MTGGPPPPAGAPAGTRRGLPRAVALAAIALATLPLLYVLAFVAFFYIRKPIPIPSEDHFYFYAWADPDRLFARRATVIRQPAWVGEGRTGQFVHHAYFPLAYALFSREGEPIGEAQAALLRDCLASVHATSGEGIVFATDNKIEVTRRAGWWAMGDERLEVKVPVHVPGKPGL